MRIYLYFADKTLIFTDETSPARFFLPSIFRRAGVFPGRRYLIFWKLTMRLRFVRRSRAGVFPLPAGIRCCRGCGRRGSERSRRIFDDSPQRALGFAQRTCGAGRKYGGMCRARSRRGNGSCGCGGGSLPLPDVACLLYARAVGAQGYALVRNARFFEPSLKPQREEGIDVAAWCPAAELKDRLEGMFPTVRRVFECLEK